MKFFHIAFHLINLSWWCKGLYPESSTCKACAGWLNFGPFPESAQWAGESTCRKYIEYGLLSAESFHRYGFTVAIFVINLLVQTSAESTQCRGKCTLAHLHSFSKVSDLAWFIVSNQKSCYPYLEVFVCLHWCESHRFRDCCGPSNSGDHCRFPFLHCYAGQCRKHENLGLFFLKK